MQYKEFLEKKKIIVKATGRKVKDSEINSILYPFQRDLTRWALKKGRAALFADCGLGKTFMQLEWARLLDCKTLIIAPLSVARQTVKEGKKINIHVHYTRSKDDLTAGINITNYEMIEKFNPDDFEAVVLDESSILKGLNSKTRQKLIDMFSDTPYRLCCTATPAPNDIAEIANHAEFLGIMTRPDMLATFFVHDDKGWRLKKHAVEPFYRWLASWAMSIRKPSDLGYDDGDFILPELSIIPEIVKLKKIPTAENGQMSLVWQGMKGITHRAQVRRETLQDRVKRAAELINTGGQWIAWCGLNDEGTELKKLIPDAVLMEGSQSIEQKQEAIEGFQDGKYRVLITKPSIAGFGMNFQHCNNMVFVGLSDSYESYYQCIRRCWRFGQKKPVNAHIVLSEVEQQIFQNVLRKEEDAKVMAENLIENVKQFEREEIEDVHGEYEYKTKTVKTDRYTLMLGDSCERMKEIESESVGLSIFSPPFLSLYTYSPTERDIGNSRSEEEFFTHFGFIIDELLRVTKPGRNCCVHVAQVPAMLVRDGYIGLKDFRGKTIDAFENRGWVYHGEVCIDKDPQAQAIRTHSKALLFTQLRKDASWLRPALADYILVFRKPGDNPEPIQPDLTNEEWIEWARPIWYGIKESDTLNVAEGRDKDDERHICPLQLETIKRCIKLWSNPGDVICSPFAGIGSEGYEALRLGRNFIGIELKESYFKAAKKNLVRAMSGKAQINIFEMEEAQ